MSTKAAEHNEHAARHHKEAAKHHKAGKHETAAHYAHLARGHTNTQCTAQGKRLRRISKITAKPSRPRPSLLRRGAPTPAYVPSANGLGW
jgi:hypothetical protein